MSIYLFLENKYSYFHRELNRVPHSPPPVEYVTRPPSPVDYVKTNNTTTTIITTTDNGNKINNDNTMHRIHIIL